MKQFLFQILALTVVILAAFFYTSKQSIFNQNIVNKPNNPQFLSGKQLKIFDPILVNGESSKAILNIEIADNQEKRSKGLSDREFLATDSGMLFIFDKSDKRSFWMKGMKFPLDIIWINEDVIAEITQNVPIPSSGQTEESLLKYSSVDGTNKVLEVNAGFTSDHNIKVGDKIEVTSNK